MARPRRDRRLARRGARCGVRRRVRPVRRRRRPGRERGRRPGGLVARVHARRWHPRHGCLRVRRHGCRRARAVGRRRRRPSPPLGGDGGPVGRPRGPRVGRDHRRGRVLGRRPGRRRDARARAVEAAAPGQHRTDRAAPRADVGPDRPAERELPREVGAPRSSRWRRSRPRRLRGCGSCQRRRRSPPSAPATRSTCTARRRPRRCCSTRWWRGPPSCTTSGSCTSTSRGPGRTSRPRWPATSAIGRCSSGRTPARPSTRAGPTTCRCSCRTSRTCSTPGSIPLDVVLVNVTPPDAHGFCSLGTSVEAMHAADPRRDDGHRAAQPRDAADARRELHPRERHRPRRRGRPAALRARDRRRSARSSAASASTSPSSSPTARRSSWASARSRPRRRWRSAASATSASTPRCSPTRSSIWSRPAWSTGPARRATAARS